MSSKKDPTLIAEESKEDVSPCERPETAKAEIERKESLIENTSQSDDQEIGDESTHSIDWIVDVKPESDVRKEQSIDEYGSDFDSLNS